MTDQRTILYDAHCQAGAKIVDFAGWQMPLHYGSQMDEHHAVRQSAGIFDVSHMMAVDITGLDTIPFLRYLLANDIGKIGNGRAMYTCMLNTEGGIKDDLICYRLGDQHVRIVVNAAMRDSDVAWMRQIATDFTVQINIRPDLAILAVQGPAAREKVDAILSEPNRAIAANLKPFAASLLENDAFIARTGYTGEDGYELIVPATEAVDYWNRILGQGVKPCGLGARDTLRLEAGLNLYGSDMDESTSPLISNLEWTVAFTPIERHFIGKAALVAEKEKGIQQQLVGLYLNEGGVLRHGQIVTTDNGASAPITSGSFSPTLGCSIALVRLPLPTGETVRVDIRQKQLPATVVKPPFVKHGKKNI